MNCKIAMVFLFVFSAMGSMGQAVDFSTNTVISTATATSISAATVLPPGRYMMTIAPAFNGDMATRLEKALDGFPGVKNVKAHTDDSALHFTVTDGAHLRVVDLQKIIATNDAGAVASTPILESSLTPHPGF